MTLLFKKLSLFALIVLIGYLAVLFVAANASLSIKERIRRNSNIPLGVAHRGDNSLLRFREIDDYHDIDILFAGSSLCYRSFDTRIYRDSGLTVFNMGSTSQSPLNSYYLLKRHLPRLNPKLLVIEVYYESVHNDGVESFLDLCENVPMSAELWEMFFATRSIISLNAILVRVFDLRRVSAEEMEPNILRYDTYVKGGFVQKDLDFATDWPNPATTPEIHHRQLAFLAEIVDMARKQGSEVILVNQPVSQPKLDALANIAELDSVMQSFADEHNLLYWNFNKLMSLNEKSQFYDYVHLYQPGVELFNHHFIEKLIEADLMPAAEMDE